MLGYILHFLYLSVEANADAQTSANSYKQPVSISCLIIMFRSKIIGILHIKSFYDILLVSINLQIARSEPLTRMYRQSAPATSSSPDYSSYNAG